MCIPSRVATKVRAMMGEALEAKATLRNARDLNGEEDQWLNELVPYH